MAFGYRIVALKRRKTSWSIAIDIGDTNTQEVRRYSRPIRQDINRSQALQYIENNLQVLFNNGDVVSHEQAIRFWVINRLSAHNDQLHDTSGLTNAEWKQLVESNLIDINRFILNLVDNQ